MHGCQVPDCNITVIVPVDKPKQGIKLTEYIYTRTSAMYRVKVFGLACIRSHKLSCSISGGEVLLVPRRLTARRSGGAAVLYCSSWKRQLPSCHHASALSGALCTTACNSSPRMTPGASMHDQSGATRLYLFLKFDMFRTQCICPG